MVSVYHAEELSKPTDCRGLWVLPYRFHLMRKWGKAILGHPVSKEVNSGSPENALCWVNIHFVQPTGAQRGSTSADSTP